MQSFLHKFDEFVEVIGPNYELSHVSSSDRDIGQCRWKVFFRLLWWEMSTWFWHEFDSRLINDGCAPDTCFIDNSWKNCFFTSFSQFERWYLPFKSHSLHRSIGTVSFRVATATTTVKRDACTTDIRFLWLHSWLFRSLQLCRNRFSCVSLEKLIASVRCSTRANKWINRRHSFSFNRLTSLPVWIES